MVLLLVHVLGLVLVESLAGPVGAVYALLVLQEKVRSDPLIKVGRKKGVAGLAHGEKCEEEGDGEEYTEMPRQQNVIFFSFSNWNYLFIVSSGH